MIKILLSGWFIIRVYATEDNQHTYLVSDPIKKMEIAFSLPQKLDYEENTWVKLKLTAECEVIVDNPVGGVFVTKTYICNGSDVIELKCTKENSLTINGVYYC